MRSLIATLFVARGANCNWFSQRTSTCPSLSETVKTPRLVLMRTESVHLSRVSQSRVSMFSVENSKSLHLSLCSIDLAPSVRGQKIVLIKKLLRAVCVIQRLISVLPTLAQNQRAGSSPIKSPRPSHDANLALQRAVIQGHESDPHTRHRQAPQPCA